MKTYNRVLTIAGSDSGGGAGIQADIKTITVLGAYATSVLSCLTAQNTLGVQSILSLPAKFIQQQIKSVLSDIGTDSVKIGLLNNKTTIKAVLNALTQMKQVADVPIIIDPVMIASSGDLLLEKSALNLIKNELIPLAQLITPNIYEAEVLSGVKIKTEKDIQDACQIIYKLGANNILIKGGHFLHSTASDTLYIGKTKQFHIFSRDRIKTKNTHGTGCTLSSAIATYLAKGFSLVESIQLSKEFINQGLISGEGYRLGNGHGPINHLFLIQNQKEL